MQTSILVVDNDATTRDLVAGNFHSADYRVLCARGFGDAYALFRANEPDVVLLDCISATSGLIYVKLLRRDARTRRSSIIMMGPQAPAQDALAALQGGADDYVPKPFSVQDLIARVSAVLRRRKPRLADTRIATVRLNSDPAARCLRVGETMEFDLLRSS